ncbi:MAG TPA: asparagine synthase (glutamine-hydrolyzing) [Candidatus Acidoferrales bacterium]|nr:asparagine synthase (glutamine-hydrolyzing) [Candidatus Acidoferrales bacterium]
MCGIAGFTHRSGVFRPEQIRNAVNSLIHRGPDEQDTYQSSVISLGSARLKIIDLDSGRQPMVSNDGGTHLVFNGEIYNHLQLRKELENLGHIFHTNCDTEVVLQAFLEWDTACFSRLRGMFAIALWNESRERLVLARDRIGIKPLYIYRAKGDICFGSEVKALLVHPRLDRQLSLEGLHCYMSLNYVPCPWTLIEGIEKLPPGHFLEWRDGESRISSYWQLSMEEQPHWTMDSAKEQLDTLLRESVREHLVSDVPLGIWLSGGIDSSTILHYAAAHTPSRLKTFSISFHGRSFDESVYIRRMADEYGTEHHEMDLGPSPDLADAIAEFAYYSDEPSADSGALPVWFLSQMSRKQVTVALSGEGADELFGGYLTYQADRWNRITGRLPASIVRTCLKAMERWPVSDDKISWEYKAKRLLRGALLPPNEAHFFWNGTFSEAEQRTLIKGANRHHLFDLAPPLPRESRRVGALNRFLWLDQITYLPDDILYKSDRLSMAHSLEVRPPFLDHRIVEFAASLPQNFKIRGSRAKYLLKELMKDKLPRLILERKKIGLDIPTHDWLRGALRPMLLDTLTPEAIQRTGIFRADAIQHFVRLHMERRANLGFHLWGLMILFLWMKRWRVQATPVLEERAWALEKALTR